MNAHNPIHYIDEGNALLNLNRFAEAEKKFKECIESFPNLPAAKERFAYMAVQRSDFEEAYTRYSRLAKEHPDKPAGHIGLANALLSLNRFAEAENKFKECIESFPNLHAAKERYAYMAFQRSDFDEAYTRYSRLAKEHPDKPAGHIGLANALLNQNLFDKAEYKFKECIKSFPNHPGAKERYAYMAFRRVDLPEAYTRYSALANEHPNNPAGHIGLGNVLLNQNLFDKAEDKFKECVESFPDNPEAKERYAYMALRRLDFDEAYTRYSALANEHPDMPAGHIGLGNVLLNQNLSDEAEKKFKECVESFPDHPGAKERYAFTALQNSNFAEAYTRYLMLAEKHPNIPSGHIGLGNVLLYRNLFDEAETQFEECIKSFPNNPVAKERYIYVALRKLEYDNAHDRCIELINEHPNNIPGHIFLITTLLRKGLFDEAKSTIQSVLRAFKISFEAYNAIIILHNNLIRYGIHLSNPYFTDLALSLYEDICTHMKDRSPCFDQGKLLYGMLIGAKNMYLTQTSQTSQPRKNNSIAIFGDSSVTATLLHPHHFKDRGFDVQYFAVGGTSITGLGKDESTIGIFNVIKKYIDGQKPKYVVLKFGQMDLEFAFYYKKLIKNEPIEYSSFCKFLIDSYQRRINQLKHSTNIVVHGTDLSSLVTRNKCAKRTLDLITSNEDYNDSMLFDKLISIQPSIVQRTQIALEFNSMLKEMCNSCGCIYTDTTDIFLSKESSTVSPFYEPNFDHHYQTTDRIRKLCIDKLLESIARAQAN